jgi:hypothetical protein
MQVVEDSHRYLRCLVHPLVWIPAVKHVNGQDVVRHRRPPFPGALGGPRVPLGLQNILLQSIGGSLRLPLLQNGACPFSCTPLLGVLMLVTPTDREVLTMCPGFRIMAVSI